MTSRKAASLAGTKALRAGKPRRVGIIGLGLMGQGIATCLLAYGYEVIGFDVDRKKFAETVKHVSAALSELKKQKLVKAKP